MQFATTFISNAKLKNFTQNKKKRRRNFDASF